MENLLFKTQQSKILYLTHFLVGFNKHFKYNSSILYEAKKLKLPIILLEDNIIKNDKILNFLNRFHLNYITIYNKGSLCKKINK